MRARAAFLWVAGLLACLGLVASATAGAAYEQVEPTAITVPEAFGGPLVLGPEDALWSADGKKLDRIAGDGTISERALSADVGFLVGIVSGPEGDLWGAAAHAVDRIAPTGAVTRYPLPGKVGAAAGIAAADGTLWVTTWDHRAGKGGPTGDAYVIRARPDGRMTTFKLPGPARRRDQAPGSIVAGPGGVWFTDPAFDRVGRFRPDGKLTEYHVRLGAEVLAPTEDGKLWFVASGGVGTIDAAGKVDELRTGELFGIGIGGGHGAVTGPEGDLWFIGEATRVLRLAPSGQLDVVRSAGAPAASRIALGPDGTIWVTTASDLVKGFTEAPLLRYETGFPAVEVKRGVAAVSGGLAPVRLACFDPGAACAGEVRIPLGHKLAATASYELAAGTEGSVSVELPAAERRRVATRGYDRVPVFATASGGDSGFTELVLRAAQPPAPRPGHPLLIPLPEGAGFAGLAQAPDQAVWTGGGLGRLNRITEAGRLSSIDVPGLAAEPAPFGFDRAGDLWFLEFGPGSYSGYAAPRLGWLAPDGKLSQMRLPPGPKVGEEAVLGADGEAWVLRSTGPQRGEIDRVGRGAKVTRFPIGEEPLTLVADRHGGVWFSESGPRIGHLDRTGRLRVCAVPHHGFIAGMTLGAGGGVWFTHWGRRSLPPAIGHLAADGRVTENPVPRGGILGSVAAAPDGDLWFTSELPRRIGRMTPQGKVKTWRRGAAAAGRIVAGREGNLLLGAADQATVGFLRP